MRKIGADMEQCSRYQQSRDEQTKALRSNYAPSRLFHVVKLYNWQSVEWCNFALALAIQLNRLTMVQICEPSPCRSPNQGPVSGSSGRAKGWRSPNMTRMGQHGNFSAVERTRFGCKLGVRIQNVRYRGPQELSHP